MVHLLWLSLFYHVNFQSMAYRLFRQIIHLRILQNILLDYLQNTNQNQITMIIASS